MSIVHQNKTYTIKQEENLSVMERLENLYTKARVELPNLNLKFDVNYYTDGYREYSFSNFDVKIPVSGQISIGQVDIDLTFNVTFQNIKRIVTKPAQFGTTLLDMLHVNDINFNQDNKTQLHIGYCELSDLSVIPKYQLNSKSTKFSDDKNLSVSLLLDGNIITNNVMLFACTLQKKPIILLVTNQKISDINIVAACIFNFDHSQLTLLTELLINNLRIGGNVNTKKTEVNSFKVFFYIKVLFFSIKLLYEKILNDHSQFEIKLKFYMQNTELFLLYKSDKKCLSVSIKPNTKDIINVFKYGFNQKVWMVNSTKQQST